MTTEDDFQAMLDANPDDWATRMVFADWLEERGDKRAEGYRDMGRGHIRPMFEHRFNRWSWGETDTGTSYGCVLRYSWYRAIVKLYLYQDRAVVAFPTRREAEDAAARAYVHVPDNRKAGLVKFH